MYLTNIAYMWVIGVIASVEIPVTLHTNLLFQVRRKTTYGLKQSTTNGNTVLDNTMYEMYMEQYTSMYELVYVYCQLIRPRRGKGEPSN